MRSPRWRFFAIVLLLATVAGAGCVQPSSFAEDRTPGLEADSDPLPGASEPSAGSGRVGEEPSNSGAAPVEFRTLAVGQESGYGEEARLVVTDPDQWGAVWGRHASYRTPVPAPPEVDFGRERVVAVFAGEKPDACWHVRIHNVTAAGNDRIIVEVKTYSPPEGSGCASVVTRPHHLVAIPDDGTSVAFRRASVRGSPPASDEGGPPSRSPVEFRTLAAGQRSSYGGAGRLVFNDGETWETFWNRHASNRAPPPDPPSWSSRANAPLR